MTYAACILWTVLLAVWSAHDDCAQIEAGERLNKPLQWLARAFGVTAFCMACGLWWMALPMGALFSSVFRYTLNRLRGLDWRYVSPSSWYDWVWMGFSRYRHWRWGIDYARRTHATGYRLLGWYANDIHRAGLLAYIAELAFAVLIFVVFV